MLFLLTQTWEVWTNTELLLDVCRWGDTTYLATAGGLLLSDGINILKTYTKLDGIKTAQVLSVACEGGDVWILTRGGLQYRNGESFKDINLIVFNHPEEILGAKRIRRWGDFLFILGKTKPTALRLTDTVEIEFPSGIGQTNVLKLFGDTLVLGGAYGAIYAPADSFYSSTAWDTLLRGVEVFDVDTFRGEFVFATSEGLRDTSGRVSLNGVPVSFVYSRNDTLWISALRALFELDSVGAETLRVRSGDVRFLGGGFVSFGYISDPSYLIGAGIYKLPNLVRIETGGLGFTSINGMVELGDSLIVCGNGLEYSCAVWPSGKTFSRGFVNSVKYINGYIYLAYHGIGISAFKPDLSDTLRVTSLSGFDYVFDLTYFNGDVFAIAWNTSGISRLYRIVRDTAKSTGIGGTGQGLLHSTEDYLIICSVSECQFYDRDLKPYGSVNIGANVVYGSGDTLLFGTSNGLYVVHPSSLSYSGPHLQDRNITGVWRGLDGRVWVADDRGLEILDSSMNVVKAFLPSNSPLLGPSVTNSLYFPIRRSLLANPQKNRLYIATDGGLTILTSPDVVSGWENRSFVYPNPARRGQTVKVKNCPVGAKVVLYSPTGVKVKESNTCSLTLNLKAGFYFLAVLTSDGRKVYKVVVTD